MIWLGLILSICEGDTASLLRFDLFQVGAEGEIMYVLKTVEVMKPN